ncbi:hypothetical protein M408DRAFT_332899 [Serendipita vermifera MAFF 305830]|uniref:Uncharacterized protein n=1 Tax=Serendipita vermifera MAFF 305830 TaxID=933852 RepID=A0A0C2WYY9_SERVB|nr:hypothetical protein M408DRAFT_332899 [Serendipita vermifera MAFF 305830]
MPPFSRMQLAAALIEYDNDPDDPDGPYRLAEESAIFLFLKGRPQPRNTLMGYDEMPRRSVDFLGVALPGEGQAGLAAVAEHQQQPNNSTERRMSREILANGRKTPDGRRSVDLLVRPSSELARMNGSMFRGGEGEDSDDEIPEEGPELNLASWGIDELLVKEPPRARSRASSINVYNTGAATGEATTRSRAGSVASAQALQAGTNRRSMNMGDWGKEEELEPWEAVRTSAPQNARPRASSMADPADIAARNFPPVAYHNTSRSRAPSVSGLSMQQFPRSTTPSADVVAPNPFAIPEPSPGTASRFDPKTLAHQRTTSFASMSTRRVLDNGGGEFNDAASVMTRNMMPADVPQRYSRSDLLRPKVLIMPALLQNATEEVTEPPKPVRDGYIESTDAIPLPPGAKTGRTSMYGNGPGMNPRSSMTLSQLTFRNSLMVGGKRDPAYVDLENNLRRAEREGEIIEQEVDPEPEPEDVPLRGAGKLYGRSLIDDLEARKAQLKSKNRVFRGDERPSMMQRTQTNRSSTLIDSDLLHQNAQGVIARPDLRRNPSSREPLLDFGADPIPGTNLQSRPQMGRTGSGGIANSRSVFGVDQVWEKELAKLQKIEELERAEEEERKRLEAEERAREEAKAAKKAAKKGKRKSLPLDTTGSFPGGQQANRGDDISPIARAAPSAPMLPAVNPFPMPPPKKKKNSSDSDSDTDEERPVFSHSRNQMQPSQSKDAWLSDDERQAEAARPRPRPRQKHSAPARSNTGFAAGLHVNNDDSDDSDAPLTSALAKAKKRQQEEDSEEDKPLAAVLNNSLATLDFGGTLLADVKKTPEKPRLPQPSMLRPGADSDDDDKPLALRSPGKMARGGRDSDDEQPLGMRYSMAPSQMFVQQQQQQQQVMMQQQMMQQQMMAAAQMRGSMFNPMMMGYGSTMGVPGTGMMPMPMAPTGVVEPPVDPAKFGVVDRWRRGVGGTADG